MKQIALAAVLAFVVAASAQAGPVTIVSSIVANPTSSNLPFAVETFGSGGTSGLVSSAALTTSFGTNISFTGNSGVYVGDVSSVTRSPYRNSSGGATGDHYLNPRSGGSVILEYASAQTAFNLLWGSVDPTPTSYNQLVFTFTGSGGSQTITGADVVAGLSGVQAGTTNLAVRISGLDAFNKITVSAT